MRLKTFLILPVLLILFLSACGPAQPTQDAAAAQPTAVPTEAVTADNAKAADPAAAAAPDSTPYPAEQSTEAPTAAPAASSYPAPDPVTGLAPALQPAVRFNIPAVDQVLDVLFGDKSAELPSKVIYEQVPCAAVARRGGPPQCAENEPEGTKLEVLPRVGGEGTFLRKDDANLKGLIGDIDLLGVYKVKDDFKSVDYYPSGTYAVIIRLKSDNKQVLALQVNDKGIVRVDYSITPPSLSNADVAGYLNPAQ